MSRGAERTFDRVQQALSGVHTTSRAGDMTARASHAQALHRQVRCDWRVGRDPLGGFWLRQAAVKVRIVQSAVVWWSGSWNEIEAH